MYSEKIMKNSKKSIESTVELNDLKYFLTFKYFNCTCKFSLNFTRNNSIIDYNDFTRFSN